MSGVQDSDAHSARPARSMAWRYVHIGRQRLEAGKPTEEAKAFGKVERRFREDP